MNQQTQDTITAEVRVFEREAGEVSAAITFNGDVLMGYGHTRIEAIAHAQGKYLERLAGQIKYGDHGAIESIGFLFRTVEEDPYPSTPSEHSPSGHTHSNPPPWIRHPIEP